MPEITSRDRITTKLQEFDDRLDGAYSAMEVMIGLKKETEKLAASVRKRQEDSAHIHDRLHLMQEEWDELREGATESQKDTEKSRQQLLVQFDQARVALDQHFNDEVDKLYKANIDSRAEYIQFAEESRNHAEKAAMASESIADAVTRAECLLKTIEQNLSREIEERLAKVESLAKERLGIIEEEWNEKVVSLRQSVDDNLISFRKEVKNALDEHQQGVDSHLIEFLAKQNILIQNLSQQIDGFQRTTQTLATEQQAVGRKIGILEEVLSKISAQEMITGSLQNDMQALSARVGQIINRLQGSLFVKGSLKGL
jgi:hypothetical protein